jgi:hypothetical protein
VGDFSDGLPEPSVGPRLFEPPAGGQGRRFLALAARHAPWRPDLIWGLWADRAGPATCVLGRLLSRPALVSVMGGELARRPELGYGGRAHLAGRLRLQAVLRMAAGATAGSALLAAQARGLVAGARVHLAPVGVEVEAVPVRSAPPWRPGAPLALAGAVDVAPVKGAAELLATLGRLLGDGVDARLTLFTLAPPPGRAALLAQARAAGLEARVTIPPPLAAPALYARLPQHHVFVSASAHESQGLALIEAALAQLPVVAPPVGVAPELAALGALTLSPSRAAFDLAPRILSAAASAPAARAAVAGRFGLEATTQAFLRILDEVAR